jgi:PadR family transcriptional regulator, regulatory protein PadR
MLSHPTDGLSGADLAKVTGLASGTIYPILFRLEKSGWLQSEWEDVVPTEVKRPRRRLYRMTAVGSTSARAEFQELLPNLEVAWQSWAS